MKLGQRVRMLDGRMAVVIATARMKDGKVTIRKKAQENKIQSSGNEDGEMSEDCPECETRNYLILPSYGNCQTCLKLRIEWLEAALPRP